MSRRSNPRLIGIFVLGALALLIGALVILGGSRLFAPQDSYVLFFEDDVAGLQAGAPVTFRGVRVGSVTDIRIRYDAKSLDLTFPVYIKLERQQIVGAGARGWEELDQMIQRGLRAQLKMQSFLTGQVIIDLDFDANAPLRLVGAVDRYPEIPTKRSSISQLRATLSELMTEVSKLQLDKLVERFTAALDNVAQILVHVDALVTDVNKHVSTSFEQVPDLLKDMRQMVGNIDVAARDVAKLTRDIDKNVPEISDGTRQVIVRLNTTLEQAQTSLGSVQDALGDRSPLQFQMTQALTEITAAASAMRVLAEYLQQNPGVLLSGKGAQ